MLQMKKLIYILIAVLFVLSACQPGHQSTQASKGMGSHHHEEDRGDRGQNSHHRPNQGHGMMHHSVQGLESSTGENEVALPPLLEADKIDGKDIYYTLEAREGETVFFEGIKTKTRGYNASFLGPVLRLQKDQRAHITLKNDLNEDTTVHWHGLIIEGDSDGGPHDVIAQGEEKEISFDVKQDESTLWFHPHPEGHTARQVYDGLAGLLYIDGEEDSFEYGVNDFPLVLQDRSFTDQGELNYGLAYHPNGVTGNVSLVNGTMNPRLTVPRGKVRLRLLNGSNMRQYSLAFDNNQSFDQIATDGGLLDEVVSIERTSLTPSERVEIIVDFSDKEAGERMDLVTDDGTVILPIVVSDEVSPDSDYSFSRDPRYSITDKEMKQEVTKEVVLSGMGPHVAINGKKFDANRIDMTQKLGETEVWEVSNRGNMMGTVHPFHIHGTQFKIVSLNGEELPEELRGYKDTVHLAPGDRVQLAVKFETPGLYMYHCHILEHEDSGMMGQILVE